MVSEHVAERCPRCGSPLEGRNPYLPSYGRYECGSYERDDTATIECYRRQLAQAQAEEDERLRREREVRAEALKALKALQVDGEENVSDDCGFLWEFEDGNPYEHGMRFCPWCGRRIVKEAQQKRS